MPRLLIYSFLSSGPTLTQCFSYTGKADWQRTSTDPQPPLFPPEIKPIRAVYQTILLLAVAVPSGRVSGWIASRYPG